MSRPDKPEWLRTHTLEAGRAVKQNAGGFLVDSEAGTCDECGGSGGHHAGGYGSIPRCSRYVGQGRDEEKA